MIHFGAEEWDGPLSLHEMMSVSDIEILSFVENYRIHLIDPAKLTEEQLNKFSTSMREVIGYIKYSKNKDKLLEFLRTDAHRSIEMNAARVIKTITNTPIEVSEEEGEIEMCKAIEDLIAESEARGRAEGEVRGEARGRAEGETRGEAKGMIEICLDMSFSKEDNPRLTNRVMANIALEYMEQMGIRDTQFFIARHFDKEHPHVHIAFNRIANDGRTISDRNERIRSTRICKELTRKYRLYFADSKEQVKRHRLKEPDKTKYELYSILKSEVARCGNWWQLMVNM